MNSPAIDIEKSPSPSDSTGAPSPDASSQGSTTLPDPASIGDIAAAHSEKHAGFDPEIHAVNPDGTPKFKLDGSYAKKRGRKAGAAGARPLPDTSIADGQETQQGISTEEAARQSANTFINGARLLFGDEWEPETKAEAENLKNSFKNYYDARGVPNIPPEFGLVVALSAYSIPRLTKENTQTKLQKVAGWAKKKFGGLMRGR